MSLTEPWNRDRTPAQVPRAAPLLARETAAARLRLLHAAPRGGVTRGLLGGIRSGPRGDSHESSPLGPAHAAQGSAGSDLS